MKINLTNIFFRERTSAQDIIRDLLRKGIHQDRIVGDHLAHIYKLINKLRSGPALECTRQLLPPRDATISDSNYPVLGVIVETRDHPALDYVISNFHERLEIPIQLFHGRRNLAPILASSVSNLARNGCLHLTRLDTDNLHASEYNALLLSRNFWNQLISRNKILIFQTDTIICRRSDYSINDFLSFDYIGSKWNRRRPVGLIIDGGNGGLSLRDWGKSYECLNRFPPESWRGGEDGYFAFHMDIMGAKVGRDHDCARFSTQYEFACRSLGAHQISCLDPKSKSAFLAYCEEAKFMADARRTLVDSPVSR